MNNKTKSSLYFASFILALITYYHIGTIENISNTEMAHNTTVQVSTPKTLN